MEDWSESGRGGAERRRHARAERHRGADGQHARGGAGRALPRRGWPTRVERRRDAPGEHAHEARAAGPHTPARSSENGRSERCSGGQ
jgi:hypothetical protein